MISRVYEVEDITIKKKVIFLNQTTNQRLKFKHLIFLKRSKSMGHLNELKLSDELNLDVKIIIQDKFKTTDAIQIRFTYGPKV